MTYTLGIDVGTSKVAAAILDSKTEQAVEIATQLTSADLPAREGRAEQDVPKILSAVDDCIAQLDLSLRKKIDAIGVTGQMHGVMLWSHDKQEISPLFTWQDQRCISDGFLEKLRSLTNDASINTGFGCATLAWFAERRPDILGKYHFASTVHDYLVSRVCDLASAVTDYTDAASWGFFNTHRGAWDGTKWEKAGIPRHFQPEVRGVGECAGNVASHTATRWKIKDGVPVAVAIGDNQASLLATLEDPRKDIGLTLGTGGQLAVVVPDGARYEGKLPATAEIRPYIDGQCLIVAASLSGGSALKWLTVSLERILTDLGAGVPPRDTIYAAVERLGLASEKSGLNVSPHFIGERSNPSLRGTITGIDSGNFLIGNLAVAVADGVVRNLHSMLPAEVLGGKTRIVGSGNGVRQSRLVQQAVERIFDLPLILPEVNEEAACGAARVGARLLG